VGFVCELEEKASASGHGATNLATYQEETEYDASDKQPPPDVEGNRNAVLGLRAVVEDLVRPLLGGQHGDGRENIQDVDEEVFEHNNIEPHIPRGEIGWKG